MQRERKAYSRVDVGAIFCRRHHQPRRPPLAKIRPGSPAPAMGPGPDTPKVAQTALTLRPEVRSFLTDYMKNFPK